MSDDNQNQPAIPEEAIREAVEQAKQKQQVPAMPACSYCRVGPLALAYRVLKIERAPDDPGPPIPSVVLFFCARCTHIIPASDMLILPPEMPLLDPGGAGPLRIS